MTLPAPGVIGAFRRTASPAHGLQFDGQISTLTTIFTAATQTVGTANVQLTAFFGEDGLMDSVSLTGKGLPISVAFDRGDWVLLPDDGGHLFVVKDADMRAQWEDVV